MAMEFKLPSLAEQEPRQAIRDINNYLYQTVQQLNIVFNQQERKIDETGKNAAAAAKKDAREAVKPPKSTFDQIKGLINKALGEKIKTKKIILGDYTITQDAEGHFTIS